MNYCPVKILYNRAQIGSILDRQGGAMFNPYSKENIHELSQAIALPFRIKSVIFFSIEPGASSMIHTDTDADYPHALPTVALNIPISNCQSTFMKWYTLAPGAAPQYVVGPSVGGKIPTVEIQDTCCIDEFNSDTPQLVKINDWHSIGNRGNIRATLISVRFHSLITMDMIAARLGA